MNIPVRPPKSLLRLTGLAIADYDMIRPGDRVLLGLSGGKDSLSLLQLLRHFQRCAPIRFEFGAVTVDPQSEVYDAYSLPGRVRRPVLLRAQTHPAPCHRAHGQRFLLCFLLASEARNHVRHRAARGL